MKRTVNTITPDSDAIKDVRRLRVPGFRRLSKDKPNGLGHFLRVHMFSSVYQVIAYHKALPDIDSMHVASMYECMNV